MTSNISSFNIKTKEENTQSLADLVPNGRLWTAKGISESEFRQFLTALSVEITRAQGTVQSLANNYIPNNTTSFIPNWEKTLGIPDDCFTLSPTDINNEATYASRRRDIIVKLAYMNVQTEQDYIDLANQFGVPITIVNSTAPYSWKYWKIELNVPASNEFPYTFPITFGSEFVKLLECIFKKVRPAHTLLDVIAL